MSDRLNYLHVLALGAILLYVYGQVFQDFTWDSGIILIFVLYAAGEVVWEIRRQKSDD